MNAGKILMSRLLAEVNATLESEPPDRRPVDDLGRPGGLIILDPQLISLIVPDLHGRHHFLSDLLKYSYQGASVFERLTTDSVQIVCVGDGMHSEKRGLARWRVAHDEYQNQFEHCPAMAEEMQENLKTMALVMRLKIEFPRLFHFLKGNHENILDENQNGNHSFAKFAAEGPMTSFYVEKFFGSQFLHQYARFEKNLPLIAKCSFFVVSHARPKSRYPIQQIINYRSHPDLIEGLTWTRQQTADPGATQALLNDLIGRQPHLRYWFCGHTAISKPFQHWPEESLFEIHNPQLRTLAILDPSKEFIPSQHIVTLTPHSDTE